MIEALKFVRHWVNGVHFILETNANGSVPYFNGAGTDIPGALIVRWIDWIRLFDFEIKHMPGKKHITADRLFRRGATEQEIVDEANEEDIDGFIDA